MSFTLVAFAPVLCFKMAVSTISRFRCAYAGRLDRWLLSHNGKLPQPPMPRVGMLPKELLLRIFQVVGHDVPEDRFEVGKLHAEVGCRVHAGVSFRRPFLPV